jgi:hypothetical protein
MPNIEQKVVPNNSQSDTVIWEIILNYFCTFSCPVNCAERSFEEVRIQMLKLGAFAFERQ